MIEFENVSFSYQGQEHNGLHEINLKISDGECVLFCGRSGCGKTTITRLVNGLIPQFYQGELQGRILVDGQKISNLPMYQIASKVGSVFQNPRTQFFNVDTDSEISFGIENEALPPKELAERVDQTTDDLNIQNLRNRNIFELSGGEKQKIAFASVYAMNPEIYLLDEPSSNLDMTSIQELAGHLRLIKAQGKTVLIAEHRLYYLMDIADRIVYLDNGRITNIFTPEELRRLPQDMRERMGLRAVDLQEVLPLTCQPASGKEMLKANGTTSITNRAYGDNGLRGTAKTNMGSRSFTNDIKSNDEELLKEMMLEMACEGKVYPAMIRMAKRYNDNSIMAKYICEKYEGKGNVAAIREKIMNGDYFIKWNLK